MKYGLKESNNKTNTASKTHKVVFLVLTIMVTLLVPVLLQPQLNILFKNLFNPPEWNILRPELRVVSTLSCFIITATTGWLLLHGSKINKRWLTILYFSLTFLWTGIVAMIEYLVSID